MTGTIFITGANGFLGRALCARFAADGWRVLAGVRRPHEWPEEAPGEPVVYDLDGEPQVPACDVFLHAAWSRTNRPDEDRRRNEAGTRWLVEHRGAAFVAFVSSCSAHEHAESVYGKTKLAMERLFLDAGGLVIRAGLVLGKGGVVVRMLDAARAPVIPLFDSGRQPLQTIHVDDCVEGIARAVQQRLTGRVILAEPEAVTMAEFQRELVMRVTGRAPRFVSVPMGLALAMTRTAERVGVKLPMTSENLLGLKGLVRVESRESLERLGLTVRTMRESLKAIRHGDTENTEEEHGEKSR